MPSGLAQPEGARTERVWIPVVDDREVVEKFRREGDEESFRFLVERYKTRVLHLVASIMGPPLAREAEDVVQEVFLRVYQKIARFRGDSSFSTWLYRVAYNTAIDHRRRGRHGTLVDGERLERPTNEERHLSRLDRLEILRQVERLPDPYRAAVYLHYWQGASLVEIGELLGAKPNTVKTYLYRARQRLSRALDSGGVR